MSKLVEILAEYVPNQDKAHELMERLFEVGSPRAVFSEPIEAGDYKVITATESTIMLGYGFGGGGGVNQESQEEDESEQEGALGFGGGGGGGGTATARPVAAIEIGPHGVRVEPIVDPTKIAVALFTTVVSMFAMMGRMKRSRS